MVQLRLTSHMKLTDRQWAAMKSFAGKEEKRLSGRWRQRAVG